MQEFFKAFQNTLGIKDWNTNEFTQNVQLKVLSVFLMLSYNFWVWNFNFMNDANWQCTEMILNEIEKVMNETFTELKCMLQGFRINFVWNHGFKDIESIS